jgi:SAM-dependent methyltransferase
VIRRSCRFCGAPVSEVFADLGKQPLANSYLSPEQLGQMEPFYPLRALVCGACFLVQLEDHGTPHEIFSDYAYFSSYSSSWLDHSRLFAERMVERFELGGSSSVVELASNDGYLLQYFAERGIPVLGIEPAANVAEVARERGIPTRVEFFGRESAGRLAEQSRAALLLGLNVLAHVPDLNDFVGGMKTLLAPSGVIALEVPHLMRLMDGDQFDTIYHEHFSYFSLLTVRQVLVAHGLTVFDVEELPTHGGSLRVYARHTDDASRAVTDRVEELLGREESAGLSTLEPYRSFAASVQAAKRQILSFLIALKADGKQIVGYGAPAKGNTLLNYCGVGRDFLDYTVDLNPHKQGHSLPGSEIPIRAPEALRETRPDVVLILPWNLTDEIVEQHGYVREWGARFAARTPEMALLP